jgi:DNA-binding MarR family transcriptional regulator
MRMPKAARQALHQQVGAEVRAQQRAVDLLDEEVARYLGINRTDLRCLDVLLELGAATPGQLARALRLTTGSVTAMIDRLEAGGYATRARDPKDRRSLLVRPTAAAGTAAAEIYGPLARAGERLLAGYSARELKAIIDLLRRSRELQEAQVENVRRLARAKLKR